MNTDMPFFAPHKASIGNMNADKLATTIYVLTFLLSMIPFAQYFVWILPLFFVYKEKSSDYVRYCAAQCFALFFCLDIAHLFVSLPLYVISWIPTCFIHAFILFPKAVVPSLLYIIIFLFFTFWVFVCARHSKAGYEYRIKLLSGFSDRLCAR